MKQIQLNQTYLDETNRMLVTGKDILESFNIDCVDLGLESNESTWSELECDKRYSHRVNKAKLQTIK